MSDESIDNQPPPIVDDPTIEIPIIEKFGPWSVKLTGNTKDLPEIVILPNFNELAQERNQPELLQWGSISEARVEFYRLKSFEVNYKGRSSLDLTELLPPEWTMKFVKFESEEYQPPESHKALSNYAGIDSEEKEVFIGSFENTDRYSLEPNEDPPVDTEMIVKIALWHVLVARYRSEVGIPDDGNLEAKIGMRNAVEDRRKKVLDALSGESDEDPKEVATRSFLATKEQDRF